MNTISCQIFLPDKQETHEAVGHVALTAESGDMDIYADHADCFAAITDGDVRIVKTDESTETLHVGVGGCYFSDNRFVLFVAS